MNYLHNNNIVITFVMSKNKSDMLEKAISKERKELERELLFYLRYYKELKSRERYQAELDYQIERLTEKLKQMD